MLAGFSHWIIKDRSIGAVYPAAIGVGNDRLGFSALIRVSGASFQPGKPMLVLIDRNAFASVRT